MIAKALSVNDFIYRWDLSFPRKIGGLSAFVYYSWDEAHGTK